MNWNLFFKNLGTLNQNLSVSSDKKEKAYTLLVKHNEKAEFDFLKRLSIRKANKNKNHTEK